ncbi:hypothetical protein [Breoghania sp.]|uniref:hypothetical protein n=1 Tax=Breoghania sp. TaxID=2065378 RepID=UPI002AAAB303|nr:hypothetical protein [Breoghania sp.]
MVKALVSGCLLAVVLQASAIAGDVAAPATAPEPGRLISADVISTLRAILKDEVIQISVKAQNKRLAGIDQARIDELDTTWRAQTKSDGKQPMIARVMSNPTSSQLSRIQAASLGLYSEIFVVDSYGLNVGQSSITSDYWQGDEAKFQKTFPMGGDAVFIDEAEWNEATKTWRAQVNMTIADVDTGTPIGAATIEINLTELQRRLGV